MLPFNFKFLPTKKNIESSAKIRENQKRGILKHLLKLTFSHFMQKIHDHDWLLFRTKNLARQHH